MVQINTSHKILCANWKMNLGSSASAELSINLLPWTQKLAKSVVWVAPSFTSIAAVANIFKNSKVSLGAQNVHWNNSGAFTGEISALMLKEEGVVFGIIGHSERRHVFFESDEMISKRLKNCIFNGLLAILCIGENEEERKKGLTKDVIQRQISTALNGFSDNEISSLLIAYEPVWAIGTGVVASLSQIEEAHKLIQTEVLKFSRNIVPPILYGGSVAPDNFKEIIKISNVSGALIGGASLVLDKFVKLIEIAEN